MVEIIETTNHGLFCRAGGFYVDPVRPVDRAVITHAHSDHARWGCRNYLAARPSEVLLRMRLAEDAEFSFLDYGETTTIGGVTISFHPAGHMLGSAQVRLEYRGRVAVITGDYKLGAEDTTCQPWEPVRCDLLVTESTFALPVYRWASQASVMEQVNDWWRQSREMGKSCVLYGYAVGKSQRLLAGLDRSIGPIYTHGAVEKGVDAYRRSGVDLPPTIPVGSVEGKHDWAGAMVVAVPSAHATPWTRRFRSPSTAMASGWMAVRGARRRRSVDRGFVLSDHVDWDSFLEAVSASQAREVWVTHGYSAAAARYLQEQGLDAKSISNRGRSSEDEEESRQITP
ncbi:MAG: ligase-associated DNA damage response exonuclease [Planctomycetota bacterium]